MIPLLEWQQIFLQLPEGQSEHVTDGCCASGHHYSDPGFDWTPLRLKIWQQWCTGEPLDRVTPRTLEVESAEHEHEIQKKQHRGVLVSMNSLSWVCMLPVYLLTLFIYECTCGQETQSTLENTGVSPHRQWDRRWWSALEVHDKGTTTKDHTKWERCLKCFTLSCANSYKLK